MNDETIFIIQFHPFYITNRINNTINRMFCHMIQYGKGTFVLLPNSNWQAINATYSYNYICYVNGSQLAKMKKSIPDMSLP